MKKGWSFSWEESFLEINVQEWNYLVNNDNPFYRLEFLQILERSLSIGKNRSWQPYPLILREYGKIIGAIVFFIRLDSYGEYIFDFEWARLYEGAGFSYYPKLTSAIPFTPISTNKLLFSEKNRKNEISQALIQESIAHAHLLDLSTIHILFHPEEELNIFRNESYQSRLSYQFHWINRGYENFDSFLSALKKERRKSIRKEREFLRNSSIETFILEGEEIDPNLWVLYFQFYKNTLSKKWGSMYLTQDFFRLIFNEFREHLVLVLATKNGIPIGGSLNFRGEKILYGRYWGSLEDISFLHFECCYYRLIEYSIQHNLERFEAGAQGEHKYLRGFEVVPIYSSHYFFNDSLRQIFQMYLDNEKSQVQNLIHDSNNHSPLKIFREKV